MAGACLFPNAHAALRPHSHSHLQCTKTAISSERHRLRCAVAKNNHPTAELLAAAQERAALRAAESSRDEPLFHDPYAACLAEEALNAANGDDLGYYELATSFIDDNLMEAVKKDGDSLVRQVVLLTDGMDTRPYRLPWPLSSTVFDVSPSATYNVAAERLEAVGARIRRGCIFRHVSVDLSEDGDWKDDSWERNLVSVGYQGTRPSVWAMQGLQTLSAEGLEVVLRCVSSLAMKDSIILGELPYSALGDISQETISAAASRVFGSIGFHVSLVLHKEISTSLYSRKRTLTEVNEQHYGGQLLFIAKQLRLSDHQASFVVPLGFKVFDGSDNANCIEECAASMYLIMCYLEQSAYIGFLISLALIFLVKWNQIKSGKCLNRTVFPSSCVVHNFVNRGFQFLLLQVDHARTMINDREEVDEDGFED